METQKSSNIYDSYDKLKKDFDRYDILTLERETELASKIQQGDLEARQELINSHLRLLLTEARKRAYLGVELQDLVMAGYEGIVKAADHFNPEKGRFSKYAPWWIWHEMQRAVTNNWQAIRKTIEVESHLHRFNALAVSKSVLENERIDEEEIRKEMGIESDRKIERLMKAWRLSVISYDTPISGDDGDRTLKDILEDKGVRHHEERVLEIELLAAISQILEEIEPRWRFVIEQHYGLKDGKEHTFQDIGDRIGVSKQRTEQIAKEARKKIKELIKIRIQHKPEAEYDFKNKDSLKKAS